MQSQSASVTAALQVSSQTKHRFYSSIQLEEDRDENDQGQPTTNGQLPCHVATKATTKPNEDLLMQVSHSIRQRHAQRKHRRTTRGHHPPAMARYRFQNHPHHSSDTDADGDSNEAGKCNALGAYECAVTLSVLTYWIFVSLIPVYNKFFFQKSLYPYPVATAGIQLGVVSLLLGLLNILQHVLWVHCWGRNASPCHQHDNNRHIIPATNEQGDSTTTTTNTPIITTTHIPSTGSYILGPHFFWKMKWCFPIGFLFGVKYGVTNLGLNMISAPTHLLLQSTDLVWTVLGAWWINGEWIDWTEMMCLAACVAGSIVLGWQVSEDESIKAPVYAIVINLISPMFLGV